jgi:hypothetical protein
MSGTVIVTKFSLASAQPASNALAQGEQAYSYISDKLWIGWDNGGVIDPIAIGGKFYTDQLKASSADFGKTIASHAITTDSANKIDLINIDNITIDGNTISTTNTNGTFIVDPNGTGSISLHANTDIVGNLTVSGTATFTSQTTYTSVNVTDLTSGRVLLAGTLGELEDSANLTFDGSTLQVTGLLDVDNVRIDGNTISAINTDGSIVITPNGNGYAKVDADTALIIPSGVAGTRPSAATIGNAAIRYNETANRFEGVVSNNWTGLGGVVDIDQDTYITAEASTDDDTLTFVAANSTEMTVDSTGVYVSDQITTPIANITTANTTTANIGTVNVTTQMQVDADANFTVGIDVTAGNVDIADNLNVSGNTVIGGNLTVNGTTTTVDSTVVTLADPVVKVGSGSLAGGDANDRGISLDYGDGTDVKTGFFGMDMETLRFTFKPDVDTADQNYVSPWGDAQFSNLYLRGTLEAGATGNLVVTDNLIATTAGDLTLTPAGGDTIITGNAQVTTDLVVNGDVTFDNDVPVTSGGTGLSSFSGDSIMITNAAGTAVSFITPPGTNPEDYIIKFNSSGVPVASNIIDGGTF